MVMGEGADKHERENVKVLSFTNGPYSVDDWYICIYDLTVSQNYWTDLYKI